MGVFDPRQGQVLPSPVTNFYKGKAIRQELADAEQIGRMRELQIEDAEYQKSQRPKQEEILDQKLDAARIAVDQAEVQLGADTLSFMAKTLAPVTSGATQLALSGDVEGGTEYFNKEIKRILPTLPEAIQERVRKGAGTDHVYDAQEIANTKLMLSQWGEKQNLEKKSQAFMLDGKPVQGWKDDFGNYYLSDGRTLATGDIRPFAVGRTENDPDAKPGTKSQEGAEFYTAKEEYDKSSDLREMVTDFMPKAIELPDAVGGMARLKANVAAAVTALGGDAAGDAILQSLSKADQDTISQMQTQLTLIRSQVRPIATGDTGLRQSDSERVVANRVVQLTENIDSPSELLKNYPATMGALKQITVETYVRQYQNANRHEELNYPYDLTSDDGRLGLLAELSNAGFDMPTALDALSRLEKIQKSK